MLLCMGVISVVGTLGAPDLAGAAPSHSAAKAVHIAASRSALRPSLFNAGHMQSARRSAATRPNVKPDVRSDVPTLYVNGTSGVDVGNCRLHAHPCLTIGYAITVAPATANIDVAADTYAEQIVDSASQDLNIVGAAEGTTIIEPSTVPVSDPDTDSSSAQNAIVDAQPGSTVDLSNLTIDGYAAQGTFTCGSEFDGAYYHDASGTMTDVTVENVDLPAADFGCQGGLAIYAAADASMTTNVTMTDVIVNTYDKNGITCDDPGTTCTVSGSTVTGDGCISTNGQNGIQGFGANHVTLTSDVVEDNCYSGPSYVASGLLLYDNAVTTVTSVTANDDDVGIYAGNDGDGPAVTHINITHCTASDATFANGLGGLGIGVDSGTAGTIENDVMKSDPGDGLAIWGTSGFTIKTNKAMKDYEGFYIGGPGTVGMDSTGNTIMSNKLNHNSQDGLYVDTETSGNTFTSNIAKADINYSYQDFSSGSGTAGTANTWHTNTCHPAGDSSPAGLC